MKNEMTTIAANEILGRTFQMPFVNLDAARSCVAELKNEHRDEALQFLAERPVHTVVMSSFINDNGLESELNRGKFFGCRNSEGELEGVALIGHATLIEARSDSAMRAFAAVARSSETAINLIMSSGEDADRFWAYYTNGLRQPRLTCKELLFETAFPFMVSHCEYTVRNASIDELKQIAEAQAEIAFLESGVDPLQKDRKGFLARVMRRIEQNRIFVVFENGKLIFKADVIAEASDVTYIEGVYVAKEYQGRGIGSRCLASLNLQLFSKSSTVCLLSNIEHAQAHKSFIKAGFRNSGSCTTLFV
ncbi:MAG: GNAT family N-acetyltransferase [Pyrinomonadaceae bacterium]